MYFYIYIYNFIWYIFIEILSYIPSPCPSAYKSLSPPSTSTPFFPPLPLLPLHPRTWFLALVVFWRMVLAHGSGAWPWRLVLAHGSGARFWPLPSADGSGAWLWHVALPRASGAWLWRLARAQGSGVRGAGQSGPLPLASGSGLLALDSYPLLPFSSSLLYIYICISIYSYICFQYFS